MSTKDSRITQKTRNSPDGFVIGGYFFSILYAFLIIIPLYFVVISAFKNNSQIITTPLALPSALDFNKFLQAQANVNLLRAMLISVAVAIGAEILTLVLAFPAAYAIARMQTRLAPITEAIFSLGFLIPSLAILMPVYLMTAKAGLLYHPIALVILYPAFSLPLSLILLTSYMRKLPRELEESAVMDGGNVLQIILYIFFPICMPGILTVLVLNFINIWNEYLFALILMDSNNRTIQLALALLRANQRSVDYGLIAAGVVISMIPVYIIFIFFQDKIMSGMLTGAIKE
ncbi:MAG TPA: carbohydrate ABC transporter permease [Anaerolineales bacterium]|nr:carbohydrate ABC transporter permease [Anaerolineales bacterium]